MKNITIFLLMSLSIYCQDKIDPPTVLSDTTANYSLIINHQDRFILGWNWGTPGRKLDIALNINFYHGYPKEGTISDDEYADSIIIAQNAEEDIIGGRPQNSTFNSESMYLEPTIDVITPDSPREFQPTIRNKNGAIFGFQYKSNELKYINDPIHPDFGRVFLKKDSISSLPKVVLDSIWSDETLRYYNHLVQ